jgi:hypothetical protein
MILGKNNRERISSDRWCTRSGENEGEQAREIVHVFIAFIFQLRAELVWEAARFHFAGASDLAEIGHVS